MKEYTPQNPVFSDKFNLVERADSVNAQIHNTSVRQAMDNTVALKNQIDSYMGSTEGGKPQFVDGIKSDNVVGAVNEVFQLGGEKKAQLVENLTAMGVQASTSDTWDELLEKILDMTDTSGDTVTAPVLLTGYTAHDASGEQISGDMPEMAAVTVEAVSTTQDSEYTYLGLPEGHYSDDSKVRTKNSNIDTYPDELFAMSGHADGLAGWTYITLQNPNPDKYKRVKYSASSGNNANRQVQIDNVRVNGSGYVNISDTVKVSARTDDGGSGAQPSWTIYWSI